MHDDRVDAGTRRQLEGLGEIVGWKMGLTVPAVQEHLGLEGPVLGHLPRANVAEGSHSLAGATNAAVEPELLLEVGADGQLARMGAALEVVDLNRSLDELEEVIATNVFQRAVAFGPLHELQEKPEAVVTVNSEERARLVPAEDPQGTVAWVRGFLARFEVELEPGQLIIAGSFAPAIPVSAGDEVTNDLGPLGSVSLSFES